MASKILATAQRRAAGGSLDAPLAVLAAVAVGFVLFAMPVDLLSRAIEMSRLPDFVSAAQPPLGTKARAAFSFGAAAIAFAATFMMLRALGRRSAPPKAPRARPEAADDDVPRVRRSDAHPDAPTRRPILAGRDFGEPDPPASARRARPFEEVEPEQDPEFEDELEEELELTEIAEEPEPFPEPQPLPERAPLPEPAPLRRSLFQPLPEPGRPIAFVPIPEPEPTIAFAPIPEPEPTIAFAPIPEPEPTIAFAPIPEPEPEPVRQTAPPSRPAAPDSISDLIERLERGLARRSVHRETAEPEPEPEIFACEGDERLRTAIERLQRMAQRAG